MKKTSYIFCSLIIGFSLLFCCLTFSGCSAKNQSLSEKIENGATEQEISQEVSFSAPQGNYTLEFVSVYVVEPDTDVLTAPEAERVAVVVYRYTNTDFENGLAIGNSHFRAFDKDGNELALYPKKGLFEPDKIGENGTLTASVAFALPAQGNYIEVDYYNDPASETPDTVFTSNF